MNHVEMLKKGIPRHTQISQWIRNKINEGEFSPEEKLPSENELARKFDVSRVTVRRALQSLESDATIYRCQGLGSFVNDKRTPHHLIRLTDFHEDMAKAGLEASSTVKMFTTVEAPDWLAGILEIGTGQKVFQIDRLRFGDKKPVAFDSTWLPILYGQLIKREKLQESTIYDLLEEYDIPVIRGCYRISAEQADQQLSQNLQTEKNAPLLLIDRISYTIGNKPVYYQKRYYRSDRVMYEMTLERDQKSLSADLPLKEFVPVFR